MAEKERVSVCEGVSIYREYKTWFVEICRGGKRLRKSLETRIKEAAIAKAFRVSRRFFRKVGIDDFDLSSGDYERTYLDGGVAVQRRQASWELDIYIKGKRTHIKLGTMDRSFAMLKGWAVANAILIHQRQAQLLKEAKFIEVVIQMAGVEKITDSLSIGSPQ